MTHGVSKLGGRSWVGAAALGAWLFACSVPIPDAPKDAGSVAVDARSTVDAAPTPVADASIDQYVEPPFDAGRAFDFAEPYIGIPGPSSRSDAGHATTNTPKSNPANTLCLDCHKVGGSAAARPFFAGGTVRFQVDGGPAHMAEVRLKAYYTTAAISAYTDEDGNWFVPLAAAQDAGVNFSVRPGVRNQNGTRTMGSSPAIGNCNACHSGSVKL